MPLVWGNYEQGCYRHGLHICVNIKVLIFLREALRRARLSRSAGWASKLDLRDKMVCGVSHRKSGNPIGWGSSWPSGKLFLPNLCSPFFDLCLVPMVTYVSALFYYVNFSSTSTNFPKPSRIKVMFHSYLECLDLY